MATILLLTHEFPPYHGGIATYCSELAAAAVAAGHSVTVAAPDYGIATGRSNGSGPPYQVVRFPATTYRPIGFFGLARRLRAIVDRVQPEILHAADIPTAMSLAWMQKSSPLRYVASIHGAAGLSVERSLLVRFLGIRDLYERAEYVVANSDFTKTLVLQHFPRIPGPRVHVAYLGVGKDWFRSPDARTVEAVRGRFGLTPAKRTILTVARLDERKGHIAVLEALQLLPPAAKGRVRYVITGGGGGAYESELRRRAAASGVEVIFTGSLDGEELRSIYACAEFFCMPGSSIAPGAEGFGLTYLEAAACGVPSIAYAIASAPEVIADGETGRLVAHNDLGALARAIEEFIDRPEEVRRLGDNARRRAAAFTWDRCAAGTYPSPGTSWGGE